MDNVNKLIESIREQEIKPKPKWQFTIRNVIIWLGFVLSVILGALSFSVVLFAIQQTDFNILSHIAHSKAELLLGLLPFIWIGFLVIFLILAIFSIKYSWKGYKFSLSKLIGINTALSVLLGTLFFITGGAQRLEHTFDMQVKSYQSIQERKIDMWSKAGEGYLSGTIQFSNDDALEIIDYNGKSWTIEFDQAFIAPVLFLEKDEKIKLIGKVKGDGQFIADEIRPWGGQRSMKNRRK